MKINKKKGFTQFALTLLITSLLLVSMNGPTSAQPSTDLIYLHGPALRPIHMHSNIGLIDLYSPSSFMYTGWHELYPNYCTNWNLTSWEDTGLPQGQLSPNDQIDMNQTEYYHVDRITVTILLSNLTGPPMPPEWPGFAKPTMAIELKLPFYEPGIIYNPLNSLWHEVWPNYSNRYNLTSWMENPFSPNQVLDPCDVVDLTNMSQPQVPPTYWHVEQVATDLILNKKITNPVSTTWHELYPTYGNSYNVDAWEDNGDLLLSPSDNVTMNQEEYYVENVMLTLNLTTEQTRIYVESMLPFDQMYLPKTMPVGTSWHEVHPTFCTNYTLTDWTDNCNGVLSYCDNITLTNVESGSVTPYHVDEVAVDIVVEKIVAPPPPQMYWKENYTDYAPSGVPDFYQRQDLWNASLRGWTWCVPTAVANSLWWMDSRFNYHPNGSRLLTNYTAGIDDHDPKNVQPFIQHLAYLMDTDGNRTKSGLTKHDGTLVLDMQTGIAQYLSWTGVNPLGDVNGDGVTNQTDYNIALAANNTQPGVVGWNMAADIYPVTTGWPTPGVADNFVNQSDLDLINAHMNETGMFYEKTVRTPDFQFVEEEVERCEDVILLLDFYDAQWYKTTNPLKELGHAVTVAGVNSTSQPPMIAISDPDMDNAEPAPQGTSGPGRVLPEGVPHVHNATPPDTLHNNASYVSHDIYNVTFFMVPPPPHITNASWALDKYPVSVYAVVEWAVIVSPLAPVEVCGVDITNVTVSFKGVVVPGGYVTWGADPNAPFPVNVTVHNNGTITTNCTVNVYCYNATGTFQIGSAQNITDLAPSNNVTLTFNWNMSSLTQNTTYTLKANATCVCGASDEFIYGPVKVRLSGDINDDNRVSIADVKIMDNIYSGVPGIDPVTRAFGDINGDCRVSIADSKIMDNVYSGLPYP